MSNSIGKYIQLQGGFAFKSSDFRESGIPLIRISNVTENGLNKSDAVFLPEEFIDELKDFLLKENDTLIAMSGATTGKCCLIKSTDIPGFINQRVGRFRILNEKETDKLFVYHVVNSSRFKDELLKDAFGSAQPNVSPRDIENVKWYFPSFTEQQHIAKILSTADAVIEKTQAAIAKYKAIKQGMLQDLFTRGIDLNTNKLRPRYQDAPELYKESKLGMIPWEWDEKIFGEEVDLIHGHQFRDYDFTEFGIPVVKIGQVKPDNVDLSSCSFVAYGREDEFQNEIIRNGDVLMALTGATLGKACLVKGLNGIVLQNYRVGRFEPIIKQNDIDKEFLYYLLIAGDLLTQIFNKVNTGAQGNIGKADFEKATFKKPPFTEQQEIAKRLRAIDNKLQTEQTYLQKMQSLKKGLMEDLLCGKKQVKVTEEVLTQNGN